MKRPNFFIVGAPKSGSTSLYDYLKSHPNIFMPKKLKEPHFFAEDFPGYRLPKTESDYLRLFHGAGTEHHAIGEASILSMYSKVAIQNIYDFDKSSKIIILLRNPVDMVSSFHSQLLYGFHENEIDFQTAWNLQNTRKNGFHIPPKSKENALLQYHELGMLGTQVERIQVIFPGKQIKIILFDRFITSTKEIYEEILDFLQVPSDNRNNFPQLNKNKRHRNDFIGKILDSTLNVQNRVKERIKIERIENSKTLSHFNLLFQLRKLNITEFSRPLLAPEFRKELVDVFSDDVKKLSEIINENLDHWKK